MLLTISELIETSWRVYTKNWRYLSTYIVLLFIPTLAIMVLGLLGIYLDGLFPSSAVISDSILIIIAVVSFIFILWVTVALTTALSDLTMGKVPGMWKAVLGQATPLLWPFIYTSVLVGLVIIGGTILFIIPGIIFAVWYVFASYEVILDNQRGAAALKTSKQIVIGRWWQIAARLVVPALIFGIAAAILRGVIMQLIALATYETVAFSALNNAVGAIINALVAPLTVGAMVALYHSAKQNPHVSEPAPPMAK